MAHTLDLESIVEAFSGKNVGMGVDEKALISTLGNSHKDHRKLFRKASKNFFVEDEQRAFEKCHDQFVKHLKLEFSRFNIRFVSYIIKMNGFSDLTPSDSKPSLAHLAPLEAILFDVDGTLCDSDPIHLIAFQELLQQIGFNNGVPIDEKFFIANIAGKHNSEIALVLFPDDVARGLKFCEDKEALFRK
ncbi:hypothetical protein F2Q68_00028121 [Brassica cretica]|uniref:Uncharacterized protein n=1 Tax=Brassica cretica TaxID=69181 RepID=A0A8S9IC98_BRACR|nr:hypothetical protein F2Q68_00028121 [Brassica cretica]